jgi:hypothetical protein
LRCHAAQDIFWLDVSVSDAFAVNVSNTAKDLPDDASDSPFIKALVS